MECSCYYRNMFEIPQHLSLVDKGGWFNLFGNAFRLVLQHDVTRRIGLTINTTKFGAWGRAALVRHLGVALGRAADSKSRDLEWTGPEQMCMCSTGKDFTQK